jgi:hypothetical protein
LWIYDVYIFDDVKYAIDRKIKNYALQQAVKNIAQKVVNLSKITINKQGIGLIGNPRHRLAVVGGQFRCCTGL